MYRFGDIKKFILICGELLAVYTKSFNRNKDATKVWLKERKKIQVKGGGQLQFLEFERQTDIRTNIYKTERDTEGV